MPAKKNGKKPTPRKPWSKDHVRELKQHGRSETSVVAIAKALKRTVGAVRNKAHILGITVGHRR